MIINLWVLKVHYSFLLVIILIITLHQFLKTVVEWRFMVLVRNNLSKRPHQARWVSKYYSSVSFSTLLVDVRRNFDRYHPNKATRCP